MCISIMGLFNNSTTPLTHFWALLYFLIPFYIQLFKSSFYFYSLFSIIVQNLTNPTVLTGSEFRLSRLS